MFIFAEWLLLAEENPFCIDKKVPRGHLAEWQVFKKLIEFMHRAYMPPGMSSFVMTRPSMARATAKNLLVATALRGIYRPGKTHQEVSMKVLMVLTSHDQLGDTGRRTGFWLEELAAPYYAF